MRRTTLLLSVSILAIVIFWMGLIMGEEIHKQNIVAALKSNDTKAAAFMWYKLKEDGVDITKHPLYRATAIKSYLKRGNVEAAMINLNMLIDLLGK